MPRFIISVAVYNIKTLIQYTFAGTTLFLVRIGFVGLLYRLYRLCTGFIPPSFPGITRFIALLCLAGIKFIVYYEIILKV